MLAYLRRGQTYADLGCGFRIGISTVYRYVREAVALLADMAPHAGTGDRGRLPQAFVILDGTLLRIDRGRHGLGARPRLLPRQHSPWPECAGIADPIGRLVWISPPLPGARHMGATREHGIVDALTDHKISAVADTASVRDEGSFQLLRYWRPLSIVVEINANPLELS